MGAQPPLKQQKTKSDSSLLPEELQQNDPAFLFMKRKSKNRKFVEKFLTLALTEPNMNMDCSQEDTATKLYDDKVINRTVTLDNSSSKDLQEVRQDKKRAKRMRERKKRALSRKERHLLDNFTSDCRPKQFDDFLPLNKLWNGYIRDYLGPNASVQDAPARLVKADFHGAMISVVQAACPSLVGLNGLVLQETMNTFKIITPSHQEKVIPKQKVHFAIKVGGNVFTIYGDHFCFRSGERSARKFKYKPFVAL